MTLHNFMLLSDRDQMDVLYEDGVYIGKRRQDQQIVIAYQLEGFYVEVFYRQYRRYVSDIFCFTSVQLLTPYLKQINVQSLLSV